MRDTLEVAATSHKHGRFLSISDSEKTMIAGGVGGSMGKTVTAPLSRLTILYQVGAVQTGSTKVTIKHSDSLIKTARSILRNEGILSFWKGNLIAVFHRFPYSAINFVSYEFSKNLVTDILDEKDGPVVRFLCGGFSGFMAATTCYPLELVRTRLIVGTHSGQSQNGGRFRPASKILNVFRETVQHEGYRGLYRGLPVSLCVSIPTLAIGFTSYGFVKDRLLERGGIFKNDQTGHLTPLGSLLSGSVSGMSSSLAMFPADVIRKRLQVSRGPKGKIIDAVANSTVKQQLPRDVLHETPELLITTQVNPILTQGSVKLVDSIKHINKNMSEARNEVRYQIKEVWKDGGLRGFYRGLIPELLKVCPMVAVTFCTYESTLDFLNGYSKTT